MVKNVKRKQKPKSVKGKQTKLGTTPKKKLPRTVSPSGYQYGKSKKAADEKRKALPPGRRISKSGRKYTENRKNRSDLKDNV